MFDDLTDLYQQVILDHCKRPRNFRAMGMGEATCSAQGRNPLCGDQLELFLRMRDDRIDEASFLGSGCCISKASASILTEAVTGRTRAEVKDLFDRVHELVTTGRGAEEAGKLAVFAGVHRFPARVKCAILPWHAVMAALAGRADPVTTEKEEG
jgi:nitrogen fixation protein NifU and related proteins